MSEKITESKELFINKYNCGQTVLAVFSEENGLDKNIALSMACGLGSGLRVGDICGAVSGAVLVIGLKCGNISANNNIDRGYTYQKVEEFIAKFKNKHGSVICRELLPEDKRPTQNDDRKTALIKYKNACTCYVEDAISILESMDL